MPADPTLQSRSWRAVVRAGLGFFRGDPAQAADRPGLAPAPFVVGVGRSGTTLLRLMLDAHPQLAMPAETGFLLPILARPESARPRSAGELEQLVTTCHTWPDFGIDATEYRRELERLDPFSLASGVRSFYSLYAGRHGKLLWGDKTPGYGEQLVAIHGLLPEARFVHLIRDGRDVALSLRAVWFAPARDAQGLARHWVDRVGAIRRAGRQVPYYTEIRYEDLVREPRSTLEALCRFLDLPFDGAMECYPARAALRLEEIRDQTLPDGTTISRATRLAQHPYLGSPPDQGRLGRWRREMTAPDRSAFEEIAGPLLRDLGYEM